MHMQLLLELELPDACFLFERGESDEVMIIDYPPFGQNSALFRVTSTPAPSHPSSPTTTPGLIRFL
jgi:hypothetical protein